MTKTLSGLRVRHVDDLKVAPGFRLAERDTGLPSPREVVARLSEYILHLLFADIMVIDMRLSSSRI